MEVVELHPGHSVAVFFKTGMKGAASAPSLSTCALTVTRCAFPLLTLLASIPSLLSSVVERTWRSASRWVDEMQSVGPRIIRRSPMLVGARGVVGRDRRVGCPGSPNR